MDTIINIRSSIASLEIGQVVTFPIQKLNTIRTTASELGAILDRGFKTRMCRAERIVTVCRTK